MSRELLINPELMARLLKDFIADEVKKVGFSKAVIGLSGGIDPTTAAYLAVNSLGPEVDGIQGESEDHHLSASTSDSIPLYATDRGKGFWRVNVQA